MFPAHECHGLLLVCWSGQTEKGACIRYYRLFEAVYLGQTTGVLGEDIACCSQESISNSNLAKGVQIKIQSIYVSILSIGSRCLSLEGMIICDVGG